MIIASILSDLKREGAFDPRQGQGTSEKRDDLLILGKSSNVCL